MTTAVPPGVCLSHGPFVGSLCPTCVTAAAVSATSTERGSSAAVADTDASSQGDGPEAVGERQGRQPRSVGAAVSPTPRLTVTPITLAEANAYVAEHHRHHKPTVGHIFSVAVSDDKVRGVAIAGRPVARALQDGFTIEVNRVATDGTKNACSMLYATCWRAARALGYRRLVTYTLASEPGTSLRAAGWRVVGETRGRSWDTRGRPRVDWHPTLTTSVDRIRWEAM